MNWLEGLVITQGSLVITQGIGLGFVVGFTVVKALAEVGFSNV